MTTAALVSELEARGVELVIASGGAALRLRGPGPALAALPPELRAELRAQKPLLLSVLRKLEGMRAAAALPPNQAPPVAVADLTAQGGPGLCFSCGDALAHRAAYGRCEPCDLAAEIFYSSQPGEELGASLSVEASK